MFTTDVRVAQLIRLNLISGLKPDPPQDKASFLGCYDLVNWATDEEKNEVLLFLLSNCRLGPVN